MTKTLAGQAALVTGASRGIGRAIATRLAQDGAEVLVHYGNARDEADTLVRQISEQGGRANAIQAELSTAEGAEKLGAATVKQLGGRKLDILVNNAGVAEFVPFAGSNAAVLDRQYAVNVRAPFLLTRALADHLGDNARVVFLSSLVADNYFAGIPAYSLTKGAVNTLVQHLAAEWGSRGIRVNAVAPGVIDTDMSDWVRSDEGAQNALSMQALQRIGKPEDIANAVAFLVGPDSGWITGQIIGASGGSKL